MKNGVCLKCGARRVAHIPVVPDEAGQYGTKNRVLTNVVREPPIKMLWGLVEIPDSDGVEIEVFVCTECGYFEEWVKDVGDVDWENIPDLRWVDRSGDPDW